MKHRVSAALLGAAVVVSGLLAGSATARAQVDQACGGDHRVDSEVSAVQPTSAAGNLAADGLSSIDEPTSTPCDFGDYDSTSYNVCFVTSSRPVSTMPMWLARRKAQELAGSLFDETADFFEASRRAARPETRAFAVPPRVASIIDRIHMSDRAAAPTRACFEGRGGERCREMPSEAALAIGGSVSAVHPPSDDIEIPFHVEDDELHQRPLVRLRVGPSAGHDSPPDRPPPV